MNKLRMNKKLKIVLIGTIILLPTICGVIGTRLSITAGDSLEQKVFGAALLPEPIAQTQGIHVFAIVLLTTMVIIAGILGGIVLSRRISPRSSDKKQVSNLD